MKDLRKTVLFIVEGSSDKSALENIFKSIYRRNRNIEFRFTSGDISSDPTVSIANVQDRIYKVVLEFMKDKKLNKSDIYQVVQIFDMDGAYIPDDAILPGDEYRFVYSTESIKCKETDRVIKRNAQKRCVMDHLLSLHEVKGLSYEMYFMSCNLDHALYNVIDLDNDLKQDYADEFYGKFIGREQFFVHFLKTDVVNGTPDTLTGSWKYIREELHSLERHTNLHVYFSQHPLPDGLI